MCETNIIVISPSIFYNFLSYSWGIPEAMGTKQETTQDKGGNTVQDVFTHANQQAILELQ